MVVDPSWFAGTAYILELLFLLIHLKLLYTNLSLNVTAYGVFYCVLFLKIVLTALLTVPVCRVSYV